MLEILDHVLTWQFSAGFVLGMIVSFALLTQAMRRSSTFRQFKARMFDAGAAAQRVRIIDAYHAAANEEPWPEARKKNLAMAAAIARAIEANAVRADQFPEFAPP